MVLENLIGRGLEHVPTDQGEIERLLGRAGTRLADANNESVSFDSRFDLAYEALLQLALTALRVRGLRPNSRGGHHSLALQTLDSTIDYPRDRLRLLSHFSRMRADGLYDGSFSPSGAEVESLIAEVERLQAHLQSWLDEHPFA
jgi:hypothetical protein